MRKLLVHLIYVVMMRLCGSLAPELMSGKCNILFLALCELCMCVCVCVWAQNNIEIDEKFMKIIKISLHNHCTPNEEQMGIVAFVYAAIRSLNNDKIFFEIITTLLN